MNIIIMCWFVLDNLILGLQWIWMCHMALSVGIALNPDPAWWRPWCFHFSYCRFILILWFIEFQLENFVLHTSVTLMTKHFGWSTWLIDVIKMYGDIAILFEIWFMDNIIMFHLLNLFHRCLPVIERPSFARGNSGPFCGLDDPSILGLMRYCQLLVILHIA